MVHLRRRSEASSSSAHSDTRRSSACTPPAPHAAAQQGSKKGPREDVDRAHTATDEANVPPSSMKLQPPPAATGKKERLLGRANTTPTSAISSASSEPSPSSPTHTHAFARTHHPSQSPPPPRYTRDMPTPASIPSPPPPPPATNPTTPGESPEQGRVDGGTDYRGQLGEQADETQQAPPERTQRRHKTRKKQHAPSETTKAMIVPVVMCGLIGPLCWYLGSCGLSVRYALWCSALVIMALKALRDRLQNAARLEAERKAARKRMIDEDETAEWLNTIFYRVWQFHEPLLCDNLRRELWTQLEAVRPSRIQAFEVTRFTLGKRAPYISSARIVTRTSGHAKVPEERIILHVNMGFLAPDLEVVIAARTSVGTIPVALKNFCLQGRMRMEVDLVPRYPHTQTMTWSFLERPIVDFDIIPLGVVNLMEVPYVAEVIQNRIVSSINQHLLDPAKVVVNLMKAGEGQQTVQAAGGVMLVTIMGAEYPGRSLLGPSEYYCKLMCGSEVMYTREITEEPHSEAEHVILWEETFAWLVGGNVKHDRLHVQLKQKRITSSRTVTTLKLPLGELASEIVEGGGSPVEHVVAFEGSSGAGGHMALNLQYIPLPQVVLEKTKPTVIHRVNESTLSPLPLSPDETETGMASGATSRHASCEGGVGRGGEGVCGVLLVCVHRAQDLQPMDNNGFSDPYAVVYYGEREVFRSNVMPKTLSPEWEQSVEFTVADLHRVRLVLRLFDMDVYSGDDALGDLDLDLRALFAQEEAVNFGRRVNRISHRWFRLRKPGPFVEKEVTAADLKNMTVSPFRDPLLATPPPSTHFGHICISLHFRPLPRDTRSIGLLHASLGNEWEDPSATCYGPASSKYGYGFHPFHGPDPSRPACKPPHGVREHRGNTDYVTAAGASSTNGANSGGSSGEKVGGNGCNGSGGEGKEKGGAGGSVGVGKYSLFRSRKSKAGATSTTPT